MEHLTPVLAITAIVIAICASIAGGIAGGLAVGAKALGNELALPAAGHRHRPAIGRVVR